MLLTCQQYRKIQKLEVQNLVDYLVGLNKKIQGFGFAQLDEIAEEMNMNPRMKNFVRRAVSEPDKDFMNELDSFKF